MERIHRFDIVRITCKGQVIEGSASTVDFDPFTGEYGLTVIDRRSNMVHYWKQWTDGGSVELVHKTNGR